MIEKHKHLCGIDFGTKFCKISLLEFLGHKLIPDDFGNELISSCLNISEDGIECGFIAEMNFYSNKGKTFSNIKNIIGKTYKEVVEKEEIFFNIEEGSNGELLIPVILNEKEIVLTATQLLAMLFSNLKRHIGISEKLSCVLSCPSYFTVAQKKELLNAASIANIKVEKILPDLMAVAFKYFYKKPYKFMENEEVIAFIDIGARSIQCSIIKFDVENKSLETLVVEYDEIFGGDNLTKHLAYHFIDKHDLCLNKMEELRLVIECEKLKIKLSNCEDVLSINIPNLYEGKNFSSTINRQVFENSNKGFFDGIEIVLQRALKKFQSLDKIEFSTKLKLEVALTGGGSKVPAIISRVKKVFCTNKLLHLDANKNIAFGCALRSLCSTSLSNFCYTYVHEYLPYQISATYYHRFRPDLGKKTIDTVFKKGSKFFCSNDISVTCYELPMIFEFNYIDDKGKTNKFLKINIFSQEKIAFSLSKLTFCLELDENGILQMPILNFAKLIVDYKSILLDDKEFSLDYEIIWYKAHINKEILKKLKEFNLHLNENNLYSIVKSKNELTYFIDLCLIKMREKNLKKYLEEDLKFNFINELEFTKKKLLDDELNCNLQSKSFYDHKIKSLKNKSTKLLKEFQKNFLL